MRASVDNRGIEHPGVLVRRLKPAELIHRHEPDPGVLSVPGHPPTTIALERDGLRGVRRDRCGGAYRAGAGIKERQHLQEFGPTLAGGVNPGCRSPNPYSRAVTSTGVGRSRDVGMALPWVVCPLAASQSYA